MNRITEKDGKFYKLKPENEAYGWEDGIRLVQIVGRLEDLEDEIGCPLNVLFKLAKQRHFYYEENKELHLINCFDIELFNNKIYFDSNWVDHDIELGDFGTIELPLNEYGISWWLKKDKEE